MVALGKAAPKMAAAAVEHLGSAVAGGIVVAPDGVAIDPALERAGLRVLRAAHPVPDARSEAAGRALLAFAAAVPADGLLLALISGGASALAAVPRDGLTLAEKLERLSEVQRRGAPIAELNRARQALSAIKGGRLAAACPAPVVTLVSSDVPGDDVTVVGSGPTLPLRPGRRDEVHLVAGLATYRQDAAATLRAAGWIVDELVEPLTGDVHDVAARVAAIAATLAPGTAWVAGGEWTVVLPADPGNGGRAVHLALLLARALAARDGLRVQVLSSDGVDGTGPAAGAIVDATTWARLAAAGIAADRALARFDAGTALAAIGATVVTGPTGVNHADLVVVTRDRLGAAATRATHDP